SPSYSWLCTWRQLWTRTSRSAAAVSGDASVALDEWTRAGRRVKTARADVQRKGKAVGIGETAGFTKVVVDAETNCGCASAIPVNTSCASFRCENSNSVAILPEANSPIEPRAASCRRSAGAVALTIIRSARGGNELHEFLAAGRPRH